MTQPSPVALGLMVLSTSAISALTVSLLPQNAGRLSVRELWLVDSQDRVRARLGLQGCDGAPELVFCAPGEPEVPRLRLALSMWDSPQIELFDGQRRFRGQGSALVLENHGEPGYPVVRLERYLGSEAHWVDLSMTLGAQGQPALWARDSERGLLLELP